MGKSIRTTSNTQTTTNRTPAHQALNGSHDDGLSIVQTSQRKVEAHTVPALARLAHDATDTWASLLYEKLEGINDTLAMTGYGKEGSQ